MTIFHYIIIFACLLGFIAGCVLIFLKAKNFHVALSFYGINILVSVIILYSLFMSVEQYTKQASLSNVIFKRNLRNESIIISGRVTNLTQFDISKCYLDLSILNKVGGGESAFNPNIEVKKGSNSVHYNILIIDHLSGNTYKDFSVQIPFPPNFSNVDFYHTLNCK